jgi:hypothetical protein
MILTVPLIADWTAISNYNKKREHIEKRNSCKEKNCNQLNEYAQNQMVKHINYNPCQIGK